MKFFEIIRVFTPLVRSTRRIIRYVEIKGFLDEIGGFFGWRTFQGRYNPEDSKRVSAIFSNSLGIITENIEDPRFESLRLNPPSKRPLSVETINFAPNNLNFEIYNHFCTKDERSEK